MRSPLKVMERLMISLLSKIFIKDRENTRDARVRGAYGTLCGALGIALNLLLFALKLFAGYLSGSVAIRADAFNNLSDAGSSVITLAGFRMAAKRPDCDHPFGHGRMEYVAGLAVSAAVILMGLELLRSCAVRLLRPEPVVFGPLPAVILAVSVLVKLYMAAYNRAVGRKIHSAAVAAACADSISDAAATAAVLVSMTVSRFAGVNIDPLAGAVVAVFIAVTGLRSARETLSPLLGRAPERDFVSRVQEIALAHAGVLGVHDLAVHDYGPGHVIMSLHAEVDGSGDIFLLHDTIDAIERELHEKLGCTATVHMDPVATGAENIDAMRAQVRDRLRELYPDVELHDFRASTCGGVRLLSFDAVLPYAERDSDRLAEDKIKTFVGGMFPGVSVNVHVDRG